MKVNVDAEPECWLRLRRKRNNIFEVTYKYVCVCVFAWDSECVRGCCLLSHLSAG